MKNTIVYVITALGAKELNRPLNSIIEVHKLASPDSAHWQKTNLFDIVEERVTELPTAQRIKQHTRWIASQHETPIVTSIFGVFLNDLCHIRPAYDQKFLENLTK